MCGLAGILELSGRVVHPEVVDGMAAALAHRGPDGEGRFVDGCVGFGHRRLAIIDPSPAGHQPMSTPDGRYTIVYNGEVFNFRELRTELEAAGCAFSSQSDTEVVLRAFEVWGLAALERFNGMFAFAIWDSQLGELTLTRDRYGIKPLYWARAGETFLFASEVKALIRHPSFQPSLDPQALLEYLTFQNIFTDRTLFAGVHLLPPGTWMRISVDGGVVGPTGYWDFAFEDDGQPADAREYEEELNRLFRQAVERSLVADVEVASYLSGGIDSGSVTAVAAEQVPFLRTFTVGFDLHSASGMELAFDERVKAERMSYHCGTEHYEMVLKAGDMERAMPDLVWHLEDLRVGQCYPNFYAAKLAGQFGKVVLSGAGGDEIFGGYPWRYYRAVVNDDFEHYVRKYYEYWQRLLYPDDLKRLLAPVSSQLEGVSTRDVFRDVFLHHAQDFTRPEDYVNHSLYLEAKTFLHGLLLVEDKLSMAHGLETRVPMLDNDLVDFAQRVPVTLKLGNLGEVVRLNENDAGPKVNSFYARTNDGKLLLRKALSRYVPEEFSKAEKQGFSGPDASWFRGESIDYVRRRLMTKDARIFEFLERESVHRLVNDHLSGAENRRLLVWSLLSLEQWCEAFLEGEPGQLGDSAVDLPRGATVAD